MCDEYQTAPRVRKDARSREQLVIQYLSRSQNGHNEPHIHTFFVLDKRCGEGVKIRLGREDVIFPVALSSLCIEGLLQSGGPINI